ncbi:MAG: nucleoside hydrolase [Actinomycetota bacterium]|nr:nucleoside hydrolase [Actinomycetota bacterium]
MAGARDGGGWGRNSMLECAAMPLRTLVIDTDPGVDDAIALLVAASSPEVELRAVTAVFGNVSVAQTTENALRILALAGAGEIPVAAGAQHPLVQLRQHRASHIHGPNGLGGVELPPAERRAEEAAAVPFLADLLHAAAGPVTVCAIGPLTNLALLIGTDPAAAARIDRLVIMGGSYATGDVPSTPEFNISSDPEAAHRVLSSGLPITVVGLDVSRKVALDAAAIARIGASGSVGSAAAAMLAYRTDSRVRVQGGPGAVLHDALAVLEAITPGILGTVDRGVSVDCGHGPGRGRTSVDRPAEPASGVGISPGDTVMAQLTEAVAPVWVAEIVDVPRAVTEIEARLCSYGH